MQRAHIENVFDLIASTGPYSKFLDFLVVLCQCNGQPVSDNQNMVRDQLLAVRNKMIWFLDDTGDGRGVTIAGMEAIGLTQTSEPLLDWLDRSKEIDPSRITFFESLITLYTAIVAGSNEKSTKMLTERMPLSMMMTIVTDQRLIGTRGLPTHLGLVTRFVDLTNKVQAACPNDASTRLACKTPSMCISCSPPVLRDGCCAALC